MFKTRLKSPPMMISSHSKSSRCSNTISKNLGSSTLGAYYVAKVIHFCSVSISQIMNLPFGSEKDFRILKPKVLLNKMATPHLLLACPLKIVLYPHSADHMEFVFSEQ